jgi:hypothetical protein
MGKYQPHLHEALTGKISEWTEKNRSRARSGGFTCASSAANGVPGTREPLEGHRSIEVSGSGVPVAAYPVTVSALLRVFAAVAGSAADAADRFVAS